jgi:hypothetical protein
MFLLLVQPDSGGLDESGVVVQFLPNVFTEIGGVEPETTNPCSPRTSDT